MTTRDFFVMAKPDAVKRGLIGEIISRLEKRGFKLLYMKFLYPSQIKTVIYEHYSEHKEKTFFENLITFSLSGPVCAMIWNGNIEVARLMIGDTLPWDAKPGTIRGDYSNFLPENLVHCSDSPESAVREMDIWIKYLVC